MNRITRVSQHFVVYILCFTFFLFLHSKGTMAAVPGSSGTGEDVTTKPTPEDPVSDTGDKGEEYVIRVDDTRSSKIRTPSKLPRIPLAPGLFDQNQLPRCGEKHVPPVCYHQTDWYKFKLMTFDPSTQYDFLMNTHGKI
eukprot:222009_1